MTIPLIRHQISFAVAILTIATHCFSATTNLRNPSLFLNIEDIPGIKERLESNKWLNSAFEYATYEAYVFSAPRLNPIP